MISQSCAGPSHVAYSMIKARSLDAIIRSYQRTDGGQMVGWKSVWTDGRTDKGTEKAMSAQLLILLLKMDVLWILL